MYSHLNSNSECLSSAERVETLPLRMLKLGARCIRGLTSLMSTNGRTVVQTVQPFGLDLTTHKHVQNKQINILLEKYALACDLRLSARCP
jgi:hypothetical protein